jgi:hypothetical protein
MDEAVVRFAAYAKQADHDCDAPRRGAQAYTDSRDKEMGIELVAPVERPVLSEAITER